MWVKVFFTPALGWQTVHETCERVLGWTSLDADISGCSMLIDSTNQVSRQVCTLSNVTLPRGMVRVSLECTAPRVDRNRAPHTGIVLWASCGSSVRCFVAKDVVVQRV